MFLINDGFGNYKIESSINTDNLVLARDRSDYAVINLSNYTIFNAEENNWEEIE